MTLLSPIKTVIIIYLELIIGNIYLQLKAYLDQIQRLTEDRVQKIATFENTQKRQLDMRKSSQQLIDTLEEAQAKADRGRLDLAELQIELEKERWLEFICYAFLAYLQLEKESLHFSSYVEVLFIFLCFWFLVFLFLFFLFLKTFLLTRFERKRVEADLETVRRKAEQLKSHADGSSEAEKLKQELGEYKEILKCIVCHDRRKEVCLQLSSLFFHSQPHFSHGRKSSICNIADL